MNDIVVIAYLAWDLLMMHWHCASFSIRIELHCVVLCHPWKSCYLLWIGAVLAWFCCDACCIVSCCIHPWNLFDGLVSFSHEIIFIVKQCFSVMRIALCFLFLILLCFFVLIVDFVEFLCSYLRLIVALIVSLVVGLVALLSSYRCSFCKFGYWTCCVVVHCLVLALLHCLFLLLFLSSSYRCSYCKFVHLICCIVVVLSLFFL